ncbi:MAG TPA: carboxypeptidase-like regulatory domain-containing protein [Terracidiphilus sp.]|nr:carboxypeptidase-like regulatory domain-containing protein [Terracidiphilus sp.]
MLSGTVQDQSGGLIPNAQVTLTNEATKAVRAVQTNAAGLYAFPSLVPGTYDIKASAKGFKAKVITGIVLNAGDTRTVPAFALEVGAESQTVTVSAISAMIPVETGARADVLSSADISHIALAGRDVTELIKVLPGATTVSNGLTNDAPMFNDLDVHVQDSSVGMGMNISGAIYRGGESLLSDGANIIDVGDMGQSLSIVNPNFTSEVSVQSSNFGADVPFGPVVVSTISKSGSANYHGEAYFNARNSVLNANDWQDNHQHVPLGPQHYYYPGGDIGGPVPGTHKHLLFWGGFERWLQNQGNANVLKSSIPTPAMMNGDFSMDDAANAKLCPHGFFQGNPPSGVGGGPWCSDLGGTVLANGTTTASLPQLAATGTYTDSSGKQYSTDAGQKFPAGFLDPGAAALAKIWPAANADPSTTGGYNYYQNILNIDNGWIYRFRLDYQLGDNTRIYGSYQQAYDADLAQGNGAHLYWTPGNAIPFPGGGEQQQFRGKVLAGHIVHNFNSTTTNDLMAAWAFGSFPFTEPKPSAAYKSTLNYPYGKVFSTPSLNIPAYSSAGNQTFPDFSQASIFENPPGQYGVRKEAPQFSDTLTKVWGRHTLKVGAFTQTTDNWQSTFSEYLDGNLSFSAGQNPDAVNSGNGVIGSPYNATANFVSGIASNYGENNSAPIADLAYMTTAAFIDDTWKTTSRMTLELGMRMEHVGHWYDRDKVGMPVFYPDRVLSDYYAGKYAPGFYWHAIDAGVPLSGQPNRFVYPDARFGLAYDLFGNGRTVVRGGWGVYRYVTQTNTPGGALPTAQHVLGYGLPGGHRVQLQNLHNLSYTPCPSATNPPPCSSLAKGTFQGGQTGLDPTDYGQPMTKAYNLTVDWRLPWNSQVEAAYVGSSTSQLSDDAEDIEGSNFSELANQNKTPIGALFQPDPVTGITATNPQNVTCNPNLATMTCTKTGNQYADYRPFGVVYGTNAVYMMQNTAYANYNGLQVSWIKQAGRLTFDLNSTWSKALGTSLQENPFDINKNYGPMNIDRPLVFNSSYTWDTGVLHTGNSFVNQTLGGWTINGISTWQAGGYIPAFLGNGVPNFGMGLQYTGLPADTSGASCSTSGGCNLAKDTGLTNGLGAQTYFGTDASMPILPVLTCNPTSGLAHYQLLNGKCFNAPAVGTQGGQNFPYMRAMSYFDNDLAVARTFHIHESQNVQFRASAFNWLNHPLPEFSSNTPITINYNVNYSSKQITPNYNQGSTGTNAFGVMDTKSQAPYQRIVELDVKYSF